MPLEVTLEKAREAQQKGELKHAIEILRSSLGNYGFSQELFKEYGELLRKCGYTSQAGKYFFLSVPEPNEVEDTVAASSLELSASNTGFRPIIRFTYCIPLSMKIYFYQFRKCRIYCCSFSPVRILL